MTGVILDLFYHSEYSPMLVFGMFGVNCLIFAWLRWLWWQRVQHMAHGLALIIVFVLLGVACITGSLAMSARAVRDFSLLMPVAQVAWILMQVAFWVTTILLAIKLVRVAREEAQKDLAESGDTDAQAIVAADTSIMAAEHAKAAVVEVVKEKETKGGKIDD